MTCLSTDGRKGGKLMYSITVLPLASFFSGIVGRLKVKAVCARSQAFYRVLGFWQAAVPSVFKHVFFPFPSSFLFFPFELQSKPGVLLQKGLLLQAASELSHSLSVQLFPEAGLETHISRLHCKGTKSLVDLSRKHDALMPHFDVPSHLTPISFYNPVFSYILSSMFSLIQGPQPEDGVPWRLHHAAGGHRVSLHPLPWPPRRTFNSKIKSIQYVITHRLLSLCVSASLHLCFVYSPSCEVEHKRRFLHRFTGNEVAAVLLCGRVFPPFPSICKSPSARQVFTPHHFCACFHKITLFHSLTPHCACMFTVMGIVMRQNCSVVFNNTSLSAEFSHKLSSVG